MEDPTVHKTWNPVCITSEIPELHSNHPSYQFASTRRQPHISRLWQAIGSKLSRHHKRSEAVGGVISFSCSSGNRCWRIQSLWAVQNGDKGWVSESLPTSSLDRFMRSDTWPSTRAEQLCGLSTPPISCSRLPHGLNTITRIEKWIPSAMKKKKRQKRKHIDGWWM